MRLRAIIFAIVGVGALGIAPYAGTAPAGSVCLVVENTASYWVAGRIESRLRDRADFRLGAGEQQRICLDGKADDDGRLHLVLKNALAMPIFMCRARTETFVTIASKMQDGKTRTFALCK